MQRRSFLTRGSTRLHSNGPLPQNGKQLRRTSSGPINTVNKPAQANTPNRRLSVGHTTELHTSHNHECAKELVSKTFNQEVRATKKISKKVPPVKPDPVVKRTRSLTMFNTSAELFDLIKPPPPLKKRRSSRLISCDSSDSGDSGVGSREGNDLPTPGTPPSPPTFQALCVNTDLISHSFRVFSDTSGSKLLTTGHPVPSTSYKRSITEADGQSKAAQVDRELAQNAPKSKIDKKKQSNDSEEIKPPRKIKSVIRATNTKLADNRPHRSRKANEVQRSRRANNNDKLTPAEKKRISKMRYMARRLNPHLQSPERELPKKMARRSLTTCLQRCVTSSPATPRIRRSRTENLRASNRLNFTRAVSEEDSGVGSDDQSQKSDADSACNWRHCRSQVTGKELQEHLNKVHVAHQTISNRVYRCYWEGCKVYGKVAKSLLWLEGHMVKHLGPKPHYCIYPDCIDHFSTEDLLHKHVETHIKTENFSKYPAKVQPRMKPKRGSRSRMLRHSEKCLVRPSDFFSRDVVEAIKWEEKILRSNWSHVLSRDGDSLIFAGEIMGLCTSSEDGSQRYLIHWSPEQFMLPDSWHACADAISQTLTKQVKIDALPADVLYKL